MITCKNDRMLELLWFVGYCGEFPSQLAIRVGGHPEWNRHVKYRAIEEGYVTVFRGKNRQRVIRSLRLTEKGIDYERMHRYFLHGQLWRLYPHQPRFPNHRHALI